MTNYFQQSLNGMEAALIGAASNSIVYNQDSSVINCDAVFGETKFEGQDYSGFVVEHKMYDFLVLVADLSGIVPENGDMIEYDGKEYEVLPIGNTPCYEYTNGYCNMYRIHTKEYT
jgi:hypothetical protein